ncbi:MAG: hypothetical protein M1356_07110 [Gammaproteobacteria bacterium]|nr:hypothetical protein [Gammaproteobacteria bacterium]
MRQEIKIATIAVASALALSACKSTDVDLSSAQSVNLPLAAFAPTPDEMNQEQRVVLLPPEFETQAGELVSRQLYNDLEQALIRAGTRVLERDRAESMADELIAAEKLGQYRTQGPQAANIVLFSRVTNAGWGSSFNERDSYTDKKGRRNTIPAYCSYSGSVRVQVRAYELPDMHPIETFNLEGSASSREDSNNRNCPVTEGQAAGLLSSAIQRALAQEQTAIANAMAPNFYVTERRNANGGKVALFRITADSSRGAQQGRDVEIFRRELRTDALTQQEYMEEVRIASGVISSQVDRTGSFVIIRDIDQADRIQAGDVARIRQGNCPDGYMSLLGSCQRSLW